MNLPKSIIAICIISLLNTACEKESNQDNVVETTTTMAERKGMNLTNLLGTWVNQADSEKSFALYNDGSVAQNNMKELALKDWTLEDNQLVFARKGSEGEQTVMNAQKYELIDLTETELIIAKDGDTLTYHKQ
ncbi:hypothetical protein GO491_08790 [Flavobacteriaceae bacterium Ap0902]|nr:hypothetical protein [Flavobacteriaceae bacterium Ap0902]